MSVPFLIANIQRLVGGGRETGVGCLSLKEKKNLKTAQERETSLNLLLPYQSFFFAHSNFPNLFLILIFKKKDVPCNSLLNWQSAVKAFEYCEVHFRDDTAPIKIGRNNIFLYKSLHSYNSKTLL